jgi:hypothetical protein
MGMAGAGGGATGAGGGGGRHGRVRPSVTETGEELVEPQHSLGGWEHPVDCQKLRNLLFIVMILNPERIQKLPAKRA